MDKSTLGDRMKGYEKIPKTSLMRRTPVIVRLDGKAFHTFTKGMKRPFDDLLMEVMQETAKRLCENVQGCKLAYTQSDEISLLLTDYEKLTTDAWFGYGIQKMASVSASMATLYFNTIFREKYFSYFEYNDGMDELEEKYWKAVYSKIDRALFDSRVFSIPKEDVANYFIWRQKDCTKNSISMVAQAYFSHKQLEGKNGDVKQDMLMTQKDVNWNDFSIPCKRGTCIIKKPIEVKPDVIRGKWITDLEIPIFYKDREYIESLI